ncbi:unnamed protein product, partial [Prorocentrum cordatum]
GVVTVSDASEFGGGVCASTSLRGEAASALKSMGQVADHLGAGARLLNMPGDPRCPWTVSNPRIPRSVVLKVPNVLVVGFVDGIGGLAVSLSRLPVWTVAHVTAETDAKARTFFDMFSETVAACVAGAGSPCQDLSRLNASGGGLHGRKSSLFYEVPRIFRLSQQAFERRFYSLLENVASMTDENLKVQVAPPLRHVDEGCYLEVMADNGPLLDIEREDQGFRWGGRPLPFPTLARCRPPPSFPSAPRGLASASGEARARWQADSPRYHVALYEEENLVQDCSARPPGRLPSCTERERLLGFDVGYTAVATKGSNPRAASNAGAFLLGSSFSAYAVARALQRALLAEPALARPLHVPGEAGRLVLHHLGRAEKGGSDALLDCVRRGWRARKSARRCARRPHFVDNQVAAAIVTKGRSSSRRLQPALRRWMAAAIAADMRPLIGHVASEDNPANEPSRKLWRGSRLRKRGEQTFTSLRVGYATRARCTRAAQDLLRHYGVGPQQARALGDEAEDAGSLIAGYLLGAIWQAGAEVAPASNTVAGACFLLPKLRRMLDLSRALLKVQRRAEPAERALPLAPDIAAATASLAAQAGAFDVGCLLLISFDGLLRGGEAPALTADDVLDRGDSIALRIRTFKTTAGKDAAEAVVIRSAAAKAMLRLVAQRRPSGEALSRRSPVQLRGALAAPTRGPGLPGRFSRHSARRGGASDFPLRSSSTGATPAKGRLVSSVAARVCIEGAAAHLARARPEDQ